MSRATMLAHAITLTGESSEIVDIYLAQAEEAILNKMYPFGSHDEELSMFELPQKYEGLCERITVYLVNKQGAEGQLIHLENGIHRHYESGDIPPSMLDTVIPVVRVIGK